MNFLPGTASLVEQLDSECRVQCVECNVSEGIMSHRTQCIASSQAECIVSSQAECIVSCQAVRREKDAAAVKEVA